MKKNNNQYILANAEVIVNDKKPAIGTVSYPKCSTTVDSKNRRVVVSPIIEHYVKNKKIFESERVKVMTRKDGTYMLTFNIHAQEDWAQVDERLGVIRKALDTTHRYDNAKKGGCE